MTKKCEQLLQSPLTDLDIREAIEAIRFITRRYPALDYHGFVDSGSLLNKKNSMTQNRVLAAAHAIKRMSLCLKWVKRIHLRTTLNRDHSSYGYKHMVEGCAAGYYIPNGIFIAAALSLGVPYKIESKGSLNAIFPFSERSVRELTVY